MGAIERIREFSEKYMNEHGSSGHDYAHVLRVTNLAKHIAEQEKADLFIVEIAALMHDLGRHEEVKDSSIDHAKRSAEIAFGFVQGLDLPEETMARILYAIENHRFSSGVVPTILEAKILQDADKLDALGALGVMRCFAFGGAHGILGYDADDPVCLGKATYEDKKYSVDHFYQKLFRLKDKLHTEAARKIAQEREKYMRDFLKRLNQEIKGEK